MVELRYCKYYCRILEKQERHRLMKTGCYRRSPQTGMQLPHASSPKTGAEREALATRYLRHTAIGGLTGNELDEAEITYVLWDWNGLALLAYAQFLNYGRGAFIGPRAVIDEENITVAFDYVPNADLAGILGEELATSLRPHIDHYHPELDFVVVWLRENGTARYEVLLSDQTPGVRSPRDLYDARRIESAVRPN
jgi:hypothetical protein